MKARFGKHWGGVATAALLATAGLASADVPRQVHVIEVGTDAASQRDWVPATVMAKDQATIATRVAASVAAVPVHEGDAVKKGQLLVQLDAAELKAAVRAAQAAFDTAKLNEHRMQMLVKANAVPQMQLDAATAQRAQAEAALQLARSNLDYAELRAPFAGRVQARKVLPGDFVGPGQPLIELQGDALELHASLTEAQAAALHEGTRLGFTVGGTQGSAVVRSLTPGSDPLAHRRGLIATVLSGPQGTGGSGPVAAKAKGSPAQPVLFRPGDYARIALPTVTSGPASIGVPRSALVERGDLQGVFVVDDGKAELRWLSLGAQDGDAVQVRAGLSKGDRVVVDPGDLRDAEPVEAVHGN